MKTRPSAIPEPLTPEIREFLEPYSEEIRELTVALRSVLRAEAPGAVELVYDAYNAVAMGYSFTGRPGDAFCHIAVYSRWVNLGFNHGADLPDTGGLLQGSGRQVRHLRMTGLEDVAKPHVRDFIRQAAARAKGFGEAADTPEGRSVVRAIYPTRRRPKAESEEDR